MYLFRMFGADDDFEEMAAEFALEGYKYKMWLPGQPVPAGAVDEISGLLS